MLTKFVVVLVIAVVAAAAVVILKRKKWPSVPPIKRKMTQRKVRTPVGGADFGVQPVQNAHQPKVSCSFSCH